MAMDEQQGTSGFEDRSPLGAFLITAVLTVSVLASVYIYFLAR
jgi:hypothetical protein